MGDASLQLILWFGRFLGDQHKHEACIYGARGETLPHGDLRRITAGNFAREVVINTPAKAGSGDEQRTVGESKPTVLQVSKVTRKLDPLIDFKQKLRDH